MALLHVHAMPGTNGMGRIARPVLEVNSRVHQVILHVVLVPSTNFQALEPHNVLLVGQIHGLMLDRRRVTALLDSLLREVHVMLAFLVNLKVCRTIRHVLHVLQTLILPAQDQLDVFRVQPTLAPSPVLLLALATQDTNCREEYALLSSLPHIATLAFNIQTEHVCNVQLVITNRQRVRICANPAQAINLLHEQARRHAHNAL